MRFNLSLSITSLLLYSSAFLLSDSSFLALASAYFAFFLDFSHFEATEAESLVAAIRSII
jgi:hypothetical protein